MRIVGLSLAKAGFAGKRKRWRFPGQGCLPPGTPTFEGLDGNATRA